MDRLQQFGSEDQADSPFMRRALQTLRPKHLIREEEDVAALMDASRTLKDNHQTTANLSSPVRQEQYSTFFNNDEGTADRLAPGTFDNADVRRLIQCLKEWLNDQLSMRRVIVRDIFLDLYDGVVLDELLDELTEVADAGSKKIIGAARGQAYVAGVLQRLNKLLATGGAAAAEPTEPSWTPERIYGCEVVATLQMLVAVSHHFRPLTLLPDNIAVDVISVRKTHDRMQHETRRVQITGNERARCAAAQMASGDGGESGRQLDAFDKLFVHAPDKVDGVKLSLLQFANKHLSVLHWNAAAAAAATTAASASTRAGKGGGGPPVTDLRLDLADGVLLIHLLAVLGGYYVPLCEYHAKPTSHLHKVANMGLVYHLMASDGLSARGVPDDVVNGDLKTTMRLLYAIFAAYKHAPAHGAAAVV